jgi:hypothetical protein
MRKEHTQQVEKTDPRGLSADEIACVVGGVTMRPDGRTCTGDRLACRRK